MKSIDLTQGKVTWVDDSDYEELSKYNWHFAKGYAKGYARRYAKLDDVWARQNAKKNKKYVWIPMHRQIMQTPEGLITDHINLNTLDNRKSNLRVATSSQNQHNRGKQKNNSSGFKGVTFDKERNKWIAQIWFKNKYIKLGRFDNIEDAVSARRLTGERLHGEFARME